MDTFDDFKTWIEKNAKPQEDAQKGVNHVYLGMGVYCPGVVGIFVVNLYYSGRVQRNN